jgi:hypothetical protein
MTRHLWRVTKRAVVEVTLDFFAPLIVALKGVARHCRQLNSRSLRRRPRRTLVRPGEQASTITLKDPLHPRSAEMPIDASVGRPLQQPKVVRPNIPEELAPYDPADALVSEDAIEVFAENAARSNDPGFIEYAEEVVARARASLARRHPTGDKPGAE